MLFFLIFASFFNLNSVALSERSHATTVNPAGLAFSQGFELSYFGNKDSYSLNLYSGTLGFSWDKGSNSYYVADGIKLAENVYLGLGLKYAKDSGYGYYGGILLRPADFLSCGYTYNNSKNYRFGLAIKPFKEYVKAYVDVTNGKHFEGGIELEPVRGINLYAKSVKDGKPSFGVEISLGNFVFSGSREDNKTNYGAILSVNPYPSLMKMPRVHIVRLRGEYDEMRAEGSFAMRRKMSFFDLVTALDSLSSDKSVKGLFLILDNVALSINQVEELRNVISKLRQNGIKVYTYSENYFLGSYLLARAGDKVFLNPSGDIFIPGLGTVSMYFKTALERLGIKPEFQRIGEYKSAAEPFIMDTMSSYNREQLMAYLNTIYDYAKEAIPEIDSIFEYALINADKAKEKKYVDSLIFESDIQEIIRKEFGKQVQIIRGLRNPSQPVRTAWYEPKYKIAYVVADGSIVQGESSDNPLPLPFIGGRNLGSSTIEKTFSKLEKDRRVKAIILRVNSPGGSALASDIMWNAIRKVSKKKPVIVTMGSVAASGGYYISSAGTKVLASKTTLTGSIGVLNGKFVTTGLFNKLGINLYSVKIGKYALSFSSYEELGPEGEEIMNREIQWAYQKFLKRIQEGRGLYPDSVDKIGRGRIWSGRDAKRIGIVDENGGILDAMKLSKVLIKCEDVKVIYYPTRKPSLPFANLMPQTTVLDILLEGPSYIEFTKPLIVR